MASTNKTTNYELSQFVGSDIPAWLSDYNGDMSKIDTGIHAAKVQADGAASGVSILQTTVSGKQDRLNFDTAPIAGSTNPVTSGGIYNALQNAQIQTDAVPTEGSTKAVQSGGVYTALQGKQASLTFDSTPTQGSNNPVTSGGVYNAISSSGAIQKIPVYSSPTLTNLYNGVAVYRVGNDYVMFNSLRSVPKSQWQSFSDSTSYKYTTSPNYCIEGNPFNLPTITTPNREYLQTTLVAIYDFIGTKGDASAEPETLIRYGSSGGVAAYYDGTCTRFFHYIFATDSVFAAISSANIGSILGGFSPLKPL